MKKSFLRDLILFGENYYSNPEKNVYVYKYQDTFYCVDSSGKDTVITERKDMGESIRYASEIAMK